MSLKILENNGTFYVKGRINSSTLQFFKTYFEYNLSQVKKIVVNIDNVIEIDKSGLEVMRKLVNRAVLKQKIFSIVGVGCKEIYDHFNQTNLA